MRQLDNFVGAKSVVPKCGNYVELINPSTGPAVYRDANL
jgi:hypothetical protein